jgi:hypothetical protein
MVFRIVPSAGEEEADADNLEAQLDMLERIALVIGMPLAAEWVRDNRKHATVWVEDGNGEPEKMFSWLAKERKLEPITCAMCDHVATEVDSLYPYHQERSRCAAHIKD